MTEAPDHYFVMAEASRAAAAEQTLDNVRRKHLTAAASWDALALGKRKMDELRLRRLWEHRQSSLARPAQDGG
jgi:hypothetical protein